MTANATPQPQRIYAYGSDDRVLASAPVLGQAYDLYVPAGQHVDRLGFQTGSTGSTTSAQMQRAIAAFGVLRKRGVDPATYGHDLAQFARNAAGPDAVAHRVQVRPGLTVYVLQTPTAICTVSHLSGGCASNDAALRANETEGGLGSSNAPGGGTRWVALLPDGTTNVTMHLPARTVGLTIRDNVVAVDTATNEHPKSFTWTLPDGSVHRQRTHKPSESSR